MASSSTQTPDPETGLIVTHGVLLAIVTLLIGPFLFFSLSPHLSPPLSEKTQRHISFNAWFSLLGNMASGVIIGIVVAVRKDVDFADPHLILGLLTFMLTLILATTPLLPQRYIRNDLARYGISTGTILSVLAVVVWIVAVANIFLGARLSHPHPQSPQKLYKIYGSLTGVSFISCALISLYLIRQASIKRRENGASRSRDLVG